MSSPPRTAQLAAAIPDADDGTSGPDVTVVVPVTERADPDLLELYEEYRASLVGAGFDCEFVFVAEPWFATEVGSLLRQSLPETELRVIMTGQSSGEAALLRLGCRAARSDVVVTLPPYRRVEASALPELVRRVEEGADLVVARRWPRRDSRINRAQNRLLHTTLRRIAGAKVNDVACGVRAMRRDLLDDVPLYGDYVRFLPLLALREGYRVEEVEAPQHGRDVGPRLHSPGTYLRRALDLLGLFVLLRFTEKPLRFFGLVGSGIAFAGILVLAFLTVERLQGVPMADRPLLLLSALLIVLGIQAIALGLIGELIVHLHAPHRKPYRIAASVTDRTADTSRP
jgi:hypothetical protein